MATPTLIVFENTAEGGTRKPVSPTNPLPVTLASATAGVAVAATTPTTPGSGGASIYNNTALVATKQEVKATPATLFGWHIHNVAAAITYIQIFNKAAANVTVGTTVPDLVLGIPSSGTISQRDALGIDFSVGLTIAATTTVGGSTAPGTGAVVALFYK